jgi:hypothetical protein
MMTRNCPACSPQSRDPSRRPPLTGPVTASAITRLFWRERPAAISLPRSACRDQPAAREESPTPRSEAVHRVAEVGRKVWKTETGYHKRSLSETAMSRFKTIIGANLKPRSLANQKTETSVAVRCLNSVTALGMPVSTKIS